MLGKIGSLVVGLSLVSSVAHAAPIRDVAIAPSIVTGELGADARRKLESDSVRGVRREGINAIAAPIVSERAPASVECRVAECMAEVGRELGVSHIVMTTIAVDGRDYELSVTLIEVATGNLMKRGTATCEICGLGEVTDQLLVLTTQVSEAIPDPELIVTNIRVTSEPSGAAAFVDGKAVGQTPVDVQVEPGQHTVKLEKQGHVAELDTLTVEEGDDKNVAYVLAPLVLASVDLDGGSQEDEDALRKRNRAFKIAGWSLFGAGIGAIVGGATMVVLHDEPVQRACVGNAVDETGLCRWQHDTMTGGIALLAAGAVGVGTGLALAIIGHRSDKSMKADKEKQAHVVPSATGLTVRF